ncbi:hypothetical protein LIER_19129 [Lithospermum erythrorhizon]|uniref:Arabinanase/levansucrase/invertase n=1 Tax=Lithospermum erythrorhizon TaxID=34254 RepID=A0AAV3QM22_LITER
MKQLKEEIRKAHNQHKLLAPAMEIAMSTTITNTINTLSNKRITNLTTLTICPSSFSSLKLKNKNNSTFILCCSKPTSGEVNAKDENMAIDSNSHSRNESNEAYVASNEAFSCSNSAYSRGLVFALGQKKSWDDLEIGSPVVKRYLSDDEERWNMWYHGRSSTNSRIDSIGVAVSSNGVHWERGAGQAISRGDVGMVMSCGDDWWAFDTQSVRPSEIVIMSSSKVKADSSVYWLYYTGFSSEQIEFLDNSLDFSLENPERVNNNGGDYENGGNGKVFKSLPGLAMSQDGRHWARIEGEHHSGALLDVGSNGEWDSLFIASPQVVFHGNADLRMYYHSFDVEKGHFAVGIARSRDGMKWLKLGKILGGGSIGSFDEYGAVNARVVRKQRDGKYMMVYEGVDANGRKRVGIAVSPDGLKNWKRPQDGPVLEESRDGWDSEGIGSPCLVQINGDEEEWRLYYRGIGKEGRTGIGMAISKGDDLTSFKKWTGFHM